MSIPVKQDTPEVTLRESNQLIGFAVNRVPVSDLIEGARKERNGSGLGDYAFYAVLRRYSKEIGPPPASRNIVFSSGVRNAADYIKGALGKIPHELSFDEALSIFRQPTTIETLALMAMHGNHDKDNIDKLLSEPGHAYMPNLDYTAIIPSAHVTPGPDGCPAAGDYETMTVKPSPLFRKFAVWSGELALRAFHYLD
jgi:hypothetical protein